MDWQQTSYVLPLIISGAVSLGLAGIVWFRYSGSGSKPFTLLMLGAAIWSWTNALELSSANLGTQIFWLRVEYLGITTIPVAWLLVVLEQTGASRWCTWRNSALLMLMPAITVLVVWTNGLHGLYWTNITQTNVNGLILFESSPGVWFWVHSLYSYCMVLIGTGLLVKTLMRSSSMYKGQASALLASAVPPWIANAIFITGLNPFSGLDPTPFALTITGTAIAWGMLRFRLMEIVPVARDAIIEGMTDGIVVLDNKNRILDINPSAYKVLESDVKEVIGEPAELIFSSHSELLEIFRGEGSPVSEISLNYLDTQLWYDVHHSPLHNSRGRQIGRVITFRDITERRLAEEALRQIEVEKQESERKHMAEQLQQAQKMEGVGRLTSGVAHDFNNLITGILGYAQLCTLALPPDNEKVRRDLNEIQKTAARASALTHQLLAFARRQASEPQVFCLNDVILEMDRMLRRLIGEDVDLFTHTSNEPGNIEADLGKIEQVLVNLVVNARDAMQSGGEIKIETSNVAVRSNDQPETIHIPHGSYVLLSVSDTGIGMTEPVKHKVFEAFFTTKEKGKGTGLGLSTCKEIVQECGGYIALESELGKGTTFRIYLPRVESATNSKFDAGQPNEFEPGTEMILLVEDEPLVREVTAQMLEDQGYHVLQAAGGTDALELALTHSQAHIDLLLTDIVMPTMGGKELSAHFKMIHPEAKVLFTSGYTDEILESHGVDHTKVSFMQKPFSADKLAQSVRDALEAPLDDISISELVESPL